MGKAKLVTFAIYIECTVDPTMSDEEAASYVKEMYFNGDASANETDLDLIGVKLVDLDENGFPSQ